MPLQLEWALDASKQALSAKVHKHALTFNMLFTPTNLSNMTS